MPARECSSSLPALHLRLPFGSPSPPLIKQCAAAVPPLPLYRPRTAVLPQLVADLVRQRKCMLPASTLGCLEGLRFPDVVEPVAGGGGGGGGKKKRRKKEKQRDDVDKGFLEAQASSSSSSGEGEGVMCVHV